MAGVAKQSPSIEIIGFCAKLAQAQYFLNIQNAHHVFATD
jgi:hypothetical protein